MSTNLYWRPAKPIIGKDLPYELKRILGPRLWDHDGSIGGDEYEVGEELLAYLEGLADAKVPGAAELAEAIRNHGRVILWIAG